MGLIELDCLILTRVDLLGRLVKDEPFNYIGIFVIHKSGYQQESAQC